MPRSVREFCLPDLRKIREPIVEIIIKWTAIYMKHVYSHIISYKLVRYTAASSSYTATEHVYMHMHGKGHAIANVYIHIRACNKYTAIDSVACAMGGASTTGLGWGK